MVSRTKKGKERQKKENVFHPLHSGRAVALHWGAYYTHQPSFKLGYYGHKKKGFDVLDGWLATSRKLCQTLALKMWFIKCL